MNELIAGLVGAIVGASITWFASTRSDRRKIVIDHFNRFSSHEMESARHAVFTYFRNPTPGLTMGQLHEDAYAKVNGGAALLANITHVVQFWETTAHLSEAGLLDDDLAQRFLRRYLVNHSADGLRQFAEDCLSKRDSVAFTGWIGALRKLALRWNIPPYYPDPDSYQYRQPAAEASPRLA